MTLEKQQRLYDALKKISTGFDKSDRIISNAERDYGLSGIEAIEMAYDNMQEVARNAIRNVRRPK